jgi:hypothetical protein
LWTGCKSPDLDVVCTIGFVYTTAGAQTHAIVTSSPIRGNRAVIGGQGAGLAPCGCAAQGALSRRRDVKYLDVACVMAACGGRLVPLRSDTAADHCAAAAAGKFVALIRHCA